MTIVLTELSPAGIAMVADSAISFSKNGKISVRNQQEWSKLLKVQHLTAGISYWGFIGLIAKGRFDDWLERKIQAGKSCTDLRSFADYLAGEMNRAAKGKPISEPAGIHVAGFQRWPDKALRPTFYHIHNGHGHATFQQKSEKVNGEKVQTILKYEWEPRTLFTRHNDFSPESENQTALLNQFQTGHTTVNGEYANFIMIYNGLDRIFKTLNSMPGVLIPRNPDQLGPRVGFLKTVIEIMIDIYKCSSMSKVIGGKVRTLGIRADQTYLY